MGSVFLYYLQISIKLSIKVMLLKYINKVAILSQRKMKSLIYYTFYKKKHTIRNEILITFNILKIFC